ncbi:MAG: VWA domain-containing protein [Candidatus Competibacter sp.]|nr:VWA domain-containing protein [Candidatus Competibacter sp.]MDG4605689.1 VWA domain-containing protein [Candidatus Contendobacter sp.]HRD48782.1 VWA domain-containing protein [Candidatus Contendobacter sp.]
MDAVINRFIFLLKSRGVRISPSESLDAMQALAWVALHDRDTVRTVLRSTLIKDLHDLPVFEELFEQFFSLPKASPTPELAVEPPPQPETAPEPPEAVVEQNPVSGQPDGGNAHEDALDIRNYFDDESMATHFNSHQDANDLSLAEFGQNLVLSRNRDLLDQVMQKAMQLLKARRMKNAGRAGELNFAEAIAALDAEVIADAVTELLDELGDLDVDENLIKRLSSRLDGGIANLLELLKRYLERELTLQPPPRALDPSRRAPPTVRFSEQERREMTEIVLRLCRRMRGARSYRRHISQRGRISVPLTLRRNMQYEGIPFQPVMTRYRDEKPRLAVICDVSLSVRNTARFMLHLVYNLQSLFDQVRSFAFVSDLVEVSAQFEQQSIDEAIGAVFNGGLLDTDVDSNYGHALALFHNRYLSAVTPQTTVIILGDGRGNRNPPQVWALEGIRRRAKKLLWLSPESRGSWKMGSCDMSLYEPVCHHTEVVRNLQQLGRVTEDLLRRSVARP